MERNNVYELAKVLQQTDGLQKDFLSMASSLREAVEQNYVRKIQTAAGEQKALAVEHPPKEVTLLRAMSAFMDESGRSRINEITHTLLFFHTMQGINTGVESITQDGALLGARSADGHIDAPSPQNARLAGLLLALTLAENF